LAERVERLAPRTVDGGAQLAAAQRELAAGDLRARGRGGAGGEEEFERTTNGGEELSQRVAG